MINSSLCVRRLIKPVCLALGLGLFFIGTALPAFENCWISLSGPVDYALSPSFGEPGVASESSQPGIREKSVTWTTSDGGLYYFGGTSLDASTLNAVSHNDLWRFDPDGKTWIWISGSELPAQPGDYSLDGDNSQMPGARDFAVGWTGADGNLYLFGGYGFDSAGGQGLLNDLWRYDVANGQWTWINGADVVGQFGQYGEQGVAGADNTPGGRRGAVAWTGPEGELYLFGGYGPASTETLGYLNDLWVFDPDTGQWTWLKGVAQVNDPGQYGDLGLATDTTIPGGRANAAGWIGQGGELYLFGGARYVNATETGAYGDLWLYDSALNKWAWIKGSAGLNGVGNYGQIGVADMANNPPSRSYSTVWSDSSGALYLFGGLFYDAITKKFSHKNDLWRYDPTASQWTWLHGCDGLNEAGIYGDEGVADPANTPGARSYATVWMDSEGRPLLYGGHGYKVWTYSELLNDLWRYDSVVNEWTWIDGVNPQVQNGVYVAEGVSDPSAKPSARISNGAWSTAAGEFFLFGGTGLDANGLRGSLNDLWNYDQITQEWTWLSGSATSGAMGVYGEPGSASPDSMPGGRDGMSTWSDDQARGYVFGGLGLDSAGESGRLNDLWRYDPATNLWSWLMGENTINALGSYGTQGVADSGNMPGSRSYAATWKGADGSIYLFGGSGYAGSGSPGSLNDLWLYDPDNAQWIWLGGSQLTGQPGLYGTLGVASSSNMPGGRYSPQTWTGPDGLLYLYGGFGFDSLGNSGAMSDMWRYDPVTNQWAWINGSDRTRQIAIYGTAQVADSENTPGCRMQGAAWTGTDGLMYLFGGYSRAESDIYYQLYSDMWRYNPQTNRWCWLQGTSLSGQPGSYGDQGIQHPGNAPGARIGAMAWTGKYSQLYLFGGKGLDSSDNHNEINDLWVFDPGRLAASGWLGYR